MQRSRRAATSPRLLRGRQQRARPLPPAPWQRQQQKQPDLLLGHWHRALRTPSAWQPRLLQMLWCQQRPAGRQSHWWVPLALQQRAWRGSPSSSSQQTQSAVVTWQPALARWRQLARTPLPRSSRGTARSDRQAPVARRLRRFVGASAAGASLRTRGLRQVLWRPAVRGPQAHSSQPSWGVKPPSVARVVLPSVQRSAGTRQRAAALQARAPAIAGRRSVLRGSPSARALPIASLAGTHRRSCRCNAVASLCGFQSR